MRITLKIRVSGVQFTPWPPEGLFFAGRSAPGQQTGKIDIRPGDTVYLVNNNKPTGGMPGTIR